MTPANALTFARLLLCAPLLYLAYSAQSHSFLGLLMFAFLLDALDGFVARWTHQFSDFGALLDSWADFVLYITVGLGAWWLWPDIIEREITYVGLILGSIVVPPLVGLIKFRQITSYHTWLTKIAVIITVPSLLLLFLEIASWPFHVAATICILAAIEEIAITLALKRPSTDIRSFWHQSRHFWL